MRTLVRPRILAVLFVLLPLIVPLLAVPTRPAGAQAGATPTVLEAAPASSQASPSGEQTLRLIGTTDTLATLDPALARDVTAGFFARQIFRGLTRLDADLAPMPELAERIEIDPTGSRYRFTLREGATFHDGSPIRAEDVVASLTRALDPDTAGGDASRLGGPTYLSDIRGAADLLANRTDDLVGVQAIDDRTVEIELEEPSATFLMRLAAAPAVVVDVEQANADAEWWRAPNGTGPFRVAELVPDERLVLEPFAAFAPRTPILSRLELRLGPSAVNAFNLYQADEIDVTGVPLGSLDRVLDPTSGLDAEVSSGPVLSTNFIAFRTDVAPMDDPAVRRAVALAFPRDQLATVSFQDRKESAEGLLPPGLMGRDWPVAGAEYDLAAARAALAESRYGDPAEMPPIQIFGVGPFGAETLRDSVGETLGLQFEVIDADWPTFSEDLTRQMLPAYELLWIADYPDPETFLWSLFASDSPDNYSGYANTAYDALLAEAAATLDPDDRAARYDEAHRMLMADGVVLPILHDIRYTLVKPWVRGLAVTPLGIIDLDDVWLER
jgi:ABC-type transport system substrate-binding protein